MTLVTKSITQPGTYTSGLPFMPHAEWLRNAVHLRHLDELAARTPRKTGGDRERNDD
jgi:UDP-3-O-[3-hydroxymyristoyl] glucosamine N-acyltransferase